MDAAIGMIEVEGVAGIIVAGDAALKAARVDILGWESTGGFTTLFFTGSLSDVNAALRSGEQAARQLVPHVMATPLTHPEPACRRQFAFPINQQVDVKPGALGLIETRGYGIQVYVNDQMTKTAAVEVVQVLTVHNRVVCTLIRGDVGAVEEAIAAGRALLDEYEHFLCSAIIPQPVAQLWQAFGPQPQAAAGV